MNTIAVVSFLGVLLAAKLLTMSEFNNSCNNYLSYFNMLISSNCYHNPDFYKDVPEIVRNHVGFCETHQVTTEDGYILSLFRIPRKNSKGVILLQHPTLQDSRIWVAQHNESVAFIFWKAGYDVWLGNHRGTLYSKKHVNMSSKDPQFWNYSLHEMGYYDHNATISYIKMITGKTKIIYLGYSVGGTTGLIYATTRPDEARESLEMVIAMAPLTYMKHTKTMIMDLEFIVTVKQYFIYTLTRYNNWFLTFVRTSYLFFPFKKCMALLFPVIFGGNSDEFDPNYANLLVIQFGSEVSIKAVKHFYQMYNSGGKFQMYDYGEETNLRMYKSKEPVLYPVKKIKVPVALVSSDADIFSHPKDNEILYEKLGKNVRQKLEIQGLNHIDFLFGRNKFQKVYSKILELLITY